MPIDESHLNGQPMTEWAGPGIGLRSFMRGGRPPLMAHSAKSLTVEDATHPHFFYSMQ